MPDILVVDDEMVVCQCVKKILSREGYNVEFSLDAQDALNRLEREKIDVVVTDLMMPKISGMELLEKVMEKWPDIPVIMITGYATVSSAIQAMKIGAFDYIPKPFTPDELASVVVRAVERRATLKKEKEPAEAPKFTIPTNIYTIPAHSWAKPNGDHMVIGIEPEFVSAVGEIINLDLPFEGDSLTQGKPFVRITDAKRRIHSVWAPLSGDVLDVNYLLSKDHSPLKEDPYSSGWVLKLKPINFDEEKQNLKYIKGK